MLDYIRVNQPHLLEAIDPDKKLSEELRAKMLAVADEYIDCSVGEACALRPLQPRRKTDMADITEIKHRIGSIQDTHQITKAMELISVAKMRKAIQKQSYSSVYFDSVRYTLKDIMRHSTDIRHKYIDRRRTTAPRTSYSRATRGWRAPSTTTCSTSRGSICRSAPCITSSPSGRWRAPFSRARNQTVDLEFTHAVASPTLHDARGITRDILDLYDRNLMDEVYVVFTRMLSTSVHEPSHRQTSSHRGGGHRGGRQDQITAGRSITTLPRSEVLNVLVPQYLIGMIYSALIHSSASEHAARMMAMSNANKNAEKMLDALNLEYNRLRQSAITTELLDLSSGRFFSDNNLIRR